LVPKDFRSLFDLAPAGVRIVDAQGMLVFANPRLAQMLGCSPEDLRQRPALESLAPEDLVLAQQAWARRLAGLSETFPCRFLRADGVRVAALVSASPIVGEQGALAGALEIITQLEDCGLRIADCGFPIGNPQSAIVHFQAILHGLREGVWLTNAQDTVLYANPALTDLVAAPAPAIVGQRGERDFPSDPSGRFAAAYAEARTAGQPTHYEGLPLATGSGRSLLVSGWLIPRSREGQYDGMICTAHDVTTRLRDATVTAGKLEHFERVLGHLGAPVIVWNAARRVCQVNRAFERVTGYRPADLLGRELGLLFPARQRSESLARLARGSPEEPVRLAETLVVRRDGSERLFQWHATVIAGAEGTAPLATVAFVQDVTERRLLEQGTQRDESGYRRLADTMRVGLWVIRADATTLAVNPFVTELLGNDWEGLAKRPFHERVAPEHLAGMQQAWGRWLAGVSETLECRFLRREGGFCDCLLSAAPLTDESGQVASVVLTLTDIGERKRREDALRDSESALRTAAENLPVGFVLIEVDGRIRAFNQPASKMVRALAGRDLESGKSMYLVVAEKDLDDFNRHFQQAWSGHPAEIDLALPAGPEGVQMLQLCYSPVGSVGGHAAGVLLTLRDVTEQQRRDHRRQEEREARRRQSAVAWQGAESAAAVMEIFLAAARELAGVDFGGLYLADPDTGDLVLVVASGMDPGLRAVATPLRSAMPGWKRAQGGAPVFATVWELVGADVAAGAAHATELLGLIPIRRDGARDAWLLAGFERQAMPSPATIALLETLAAEAGVALRRLNVEEELRRGQAPKPSPAEWQAKLFGSLAHECRTPAAVAIGAAELLQGHLAKLPEGRRQELLELVVQSSRRLVAILDGLSVLSQTAGAFVAPVPPPVELYHLAQQIIAAAQAADAARHPIHFAPAAGTCAAAVDGAWFGQILRVLLDNALRFSPAGSPVTVTLELRGAEVVLAVDDQGIGVPEEDRARIFEPFEHGSNSGEAAGAGLGLAVASRLASAMGGSLQCVPKSGAGARFVCELRCH
jgi:PAS domain S-box-containing protein